MATKGECYVDTSALIALVDRSDTHHRTFRRLFGAPPSLYTTPLVLAEGQAWFLRRYDRWRALQFLAMIDDMKPLTVVPLGRREHDAATAVLRRFSDQDLTLADALGLHVIEARHTRTVWSTDFHLGLTGARLVV
jgi:predicted nucleic acid-binding protein